MNSIINKLTGLSGLWNKVDGAKTYIGGGISLLSGAAGFLQEVLTLVDHKNAIEAWTFVKHLPQDTNVAMIAAGLVAVGLRHAIAKTDAPAQPAPAQPAQ